jgi:hypothetical protein
MCTYNIYNENIISHSKCGTRYLNEQFNNHNNPPQIDAIKLIESIDFSKIKWVIIRNPFDHFLSAVDTLSNDFRYMSELHNVKPEDDLFLEVLRTFLMGDDDHWSPSFFKHIYILSKKVNLTLVHLKDLSNFMENEIKLSLVLYSKKHSSRNSNNGNEIEIKIDKLHPEMGIIMRNLLRDELYFYNKLIEENEIFKPFKLIKGNKIFKPFKII